MKIRLRLSIRMIVFIVATATIAFFTTLRIIGKNFKEAAFVETIETANSQVIKFASIIKINLEKGFNITRSYVDAIEDNSTLDYNNKRKIFDETLIQIAENNSDYTAVWDSWELRFTDENWNKNYGRVSRSFFYDENGSIKVKQDTLDKYGDNHESIYYFNKIAPEEAITDPYWFSYTNSKVDEILETSLIVPIIIKDEFAGMAGIDLNLDHFQKMIDSINAEHNYEAVLFSFNGDIIAHPEKGFIGKNIVQVDTFLTNRYSILDKIQSGENSNYTLKNMHGIDSVYYTLSSFVIGNTYTPWAVLIKKPLSAIEKQIDMTFKFGNTVAWLGIGILTLVVLIFALRIVLPLRRTRNILSDLALGNVRDINKLEVKSSDEIGEMANSLNTVIEGLNKVTKFAESIGDGDYNYEFEKLSEKDSLGTAILEMRDSLRVAKVEEKKRIEEEEQQEWTSKGINLFNKVLQVDNQNLDELSYKIIQTLTVYLGAHMGGIYLKTDINSKEFELIAYIGFSKEKYEKKNIAEGEGVVGKCMLEKEPIFINDVPSDFSVVSSGLGSTVPTSILVVPLLSNRILVGILELESLKEIKPYQISFVEKTAETIASTLATVKTNEQTAKLLDKSKKQAEELEQQEEEMRQNMEEMQATQEEATKREDELKNTIEAISEIVPIIEYDRRGKIIDVNDNYLKIYKTRKSQLLGKHHKSELFLNEEETAKHNKFWEDLNEGIGQESVEYIKAGKEEYWLLEKYIPVKDKYGLIQKILCVGIDITEQKKIESEIQKRKHKGKKSDYASGEKVEPQGPSINLNQELEFIDLTYLKMVYKKDSHKIYNIIKLYYETLPEQIRELTPLVKSRDYKKLKTKINGLKTKMSYLGLKSVYEKLRVIETMIIEQKNLVEIPGLLDNIYQIWSGAESELRKLLGLSSD